MIYEEECNNIIHLQCLCINKAPYKATVYDIPLMIVVIPGQDPINHAYFVNIVVGTADVKCWLSYYFVYELARDETWM